LRRKGPDSLFVDGAANARPSPAVPQVLLLPLTLDLTGITLKNK